METTFTAFQRKFRAMRAIAERGEAITIRRGREKYLFLKEEEPTRPYEGMEEVLAELGLKVKPLPKAKNEKAKSHRR
jgi:hypothetical protein